MKEISEVISEHENKEKNKKKNEEMNKVYRDYLNRIKVLLKNDLCMMKEIENTDEYTKITDFKIPIVNETKYYYLFRNITTNKLYFIAKIGYRTTDTTSIVIITDHISEVDAEIVLNNALLEQKEKLSGDSFDLETIGYLLGILVLVIAVIMFLIALSAGLIAVLVLVGPIILAYIIFALANIIKRLKVVNEKLEKIENSEIKDEMRS